MVARSVSEAARAGRPVVSAVRVGACIAVVTAIAGLVSIKGGEIRDRLDTDKARAIAQDDRLFCTRFGIEPGTVRYTECTAALADVRSRHDQRRADLFF